MTTKFNKLTAEDVCTSDQLRSEYMHQLIYKESNIGPKGNTPVIPFLLVQYWNDLDAIPLDVQKCIDSWKVLKKLGFKHFLFDDKSAKKFIKENLDPAHLKAFASCNHPAMRADYFRLCFILVNGGFYVDVDDVYAGRDLITYFCDEKLKLRPLCYNLQSDSMVKISEGVSLLYDPSKFIFYVNNNPIISPSNHPVIYAALERATQTLLNQKTGGRQDIQSTTGPGSLTASLVRNAIEVNESSMTSNFELISDWDEIAVTKWSLQYRLDKRNWRLWDGLEKSVNTKNESIK